MLSILKTFDDYACLMMWAQQYDFITISIGHMARITPP